MGSISFRSHRALAAALGTACRKHCPKVEITCLSVYIPIFMSLLNVHANWFPVDGHIKSVKHEDGNFHKAWLPKASLENERSTIIIETPEGHNIRVRQVAGAMARRIVSYAHENDQCYIDEHLGFIKFGSRVDMYLPLGSEILVSLGQKTPGDTTIIAKLPKNNG